MSELEAFCKADSETSVWSGYALEDKPIMAINGALGTAYLVNPSNEIKSVFAQEIAMPEGSGIRVYRLSVLTPQVFPMRFDAGNFNTLGKSYSIFGNEVYFTRYAAKESLDAQYSSKHYITFLTHEAFHYYMQDHWPDGGRFSEDLSGTDIDLIAEEYDVLAQIQSELAESNPSNDALLQSAKDYADVMGRRLGANPRYLSAEISMETIEGTAQYVGIKASEIVGYDYGVMYFDNTKDVSFSDVIPALRAGQIEQSFLADRMPYETGALLCELLDALRVDGWQERLKAQTKENPVTLYSVICDYLTVE